MRKVRGKQKEPLCRCGSLAHKLIVSGGKTHYWCVLCGPPEGVAVREDFMVEKGSGMKTPDTCKVLFPMLSSGDRFSLSNRSNARIYEKIAVGIAKSATGKLVYLGARTWVWLREK